MDRAARAPWAAVRYVDPNDSSPEHLCAVSFESNPRCGGRGVYNRQDMRRPTHSGAWCVSKSPIGQSPSRLSHHAQDRTSPQRDSACRSFGPSMYALATPTSRAQSETHDSGPELLPRPTQPTCECVTQSITYAHTSRKTIGHCCIAARKAHEPPPAPPWRQTSCTCLFRPTRASSGRTSSWCDAPSENFSALPARLGARGPNFIHHTFGGRSASCPATRPCTLNRSGPPAWSGQRSARSPPV